MTGTFEINLDRHKLRTPLGNVVQIPSEPIALGVAEEWRSQDKVINRFNMQLVSDDDDYCFCYNNDGDVLSISFKNICVYVFLCLMIYK